MCASRWRRRCGALRAQGGKSLGKGSLFVVGLGGFQVANELGLGIMAVVRVVNRCQDD
jgi:hypothetical protein